MRTDATIAEMTDEMIDVMIDVMIVAMIDETIAGMTADMEGAIADTTVARAEATMAEMTDAATHLQPSMTRVRATTATATTSALLLTTTDTERIRTTHSTLLPTECILLVTTHSSLPCTLRRTPIPRRLRHQMPILRRQRTRILMHRIVTLLPMSVDVFVEYGFLD